MSSKEETSHLWPKDRPIYRESKPRYRVLRTPRNYHVIAPGTYYTLCRRYVNKGEGEREGIYLSFRAVKAIVTCPGCLVRMDESEQPEYGMP